MEPATSTSEHRRNILERINALGGRVEFAATNGKAIEAIVIKNSRIARDDLDQIAMLGHDLKRLILMKCDIDSEGLSQLKRLSGLKSLCVDDANFSDEDTSYLNAECIETISLSNCRISDASMPFLAMCSQLVTVDLSGTQVTDDGVSLLAQLTKLDYLNLSRTGVCGRFLRDWKKPVIRELDLSRTPINDSEAKSLLVFRDSLVSQINITQSRITEKTLQSLRDDMACEIIWESE